MKCRTSSFESSRKLSKSLYLLVDLSRLCHQLNKFSFDFSEEAERLNVWVALLSMEVAYGNDEVIDDTLKRALQYNDQLKVYNHMITIYNKANQREVSHYLR